MLDIIDVEKISDKIGLDEVVVKRLLQSLKESFETFVQRLEDGEFTKTLFHTIKGASGNMRLANLAELAASLENTAEEMNEKQQQEAKSLILSHLQNALKQIDNL